jgi:hypothetical protein
MATAEIKNIEHCNAIELKFIEAIIASKKEGIITEEQAMLEIRAIVNKYGNDEQK